MVYICRYTPNPDTQFAIPNKLPKLFFVQQHTAQENIKQVLLTIIFCQMQRGIFTYSKLVGQYSKEESGEKGRA